MCRNVENLANVGLTDAQKAYATVVGESQNILVKGTGYAGSTLSLKENILLNIVFQNATIDAAAYATVSYTSYNGDEVSYEVESAKFVRLNSNMKYVQINTLKVADFGQAVTVTLHKADGTVISTVVESIESYQIRNSAQSALYPATLAFCEGAYNYLKK